MKPYILSLLIPLTASAGTQKTLKVTSTAFKANEAIPSEYTCDGDNKSPPLAWSNVPKQAKSVSLLVEDPDAPKGTFTHWLVTDLPTTTTSLAVDAQIPQGAVAAKNDKGSTGYTGPCPPSGTHHYHFHVYALDKEIGPQHSQSDFMSAIRGHVLAEGDLIATYEKQMKK